MNAKRLTLLAVGLLVLILSAAATHSVGSAVLARNAQQAEGATEYRAYVLPDPRYLC